MRWQCVPKPPPACVIPVQLEVSRFKVVVEFSVAPPHTLRWRRSYPLKVSEHCLCLRETPLFDDRGRVQPILAMCTGYLAYRGEDSMASGRVRQAAGSAYVGV